MAWQEVGGALTGGANVTIDPNVNWLGTRNAAPLIIRTENATAAPVPGTEVMRITPATGFGLGRGPRDRSVGIGTPEPEAKLHVHYSGDPWPALHVSGSAASLSFASQTSPDPFIPDGQDGNRWLWEAHSDGGTTSNARLWSRGDRLIITAGVGQVLLPLIDGQFSPDGSGGIDDYSVDFPAVPIGTLPPHPP